MRFGGNEIRLVYEIQTRVVHGPKDRLTAFNLKFRISGPTYMYHVPLFITITSEKNRAEYVFRKIFLWEMKIMTTYSVRLSQYLRLDSF